LSPSGRSRLTLAARYEAGIWRSLCRWLTRRGATDPDAALSGYASQVTPLLLAFIFLSALEIPNSLGHVSINAVAPVLDYDTDAFWGVVGRLRLDLIASAARKAAASSTPVTS
jgi:hypothetical protein